MCVSIVGTIGSTLHVSDGITWQAVVLDSHEFIEYRKILPSKKKVVSDVLNMGSLVRRYNCHCQ